ncbi:MAG: ADP-ribosylation factor-like protein [Promethearchaeota archaeon]
MINGIFLVEWEKLKDNISIHLNSGNNGSNLEKINVENPKIVSIFPRDDITLNNSATLNRIINSHMPQIEKLSDKIGKIRNQGSKANNLVKESEEGSLGFLNSEVEKLFFEKIAGISSGMDYKTNPMNFYSSAKNIEEKDTPIEKKEEIDKSFFASLGKKSLQTQIIYGSSIYSCYLPPNRILCLVFNDSENPLDYTKEFEKSLDLFIFSKFSAFYNSSRFELENILVSIFIDIRCHGLTLSEEPPYLVATQQDKKQSVKYTKIIKVFLYGIDNAGKSSFVRFLKTGRFDHNYFLPTKKFVIHKFKLPIYKNNGRKDVRLVCWEMPGQKSFRRVWLRGVQESNLLIFMLDAEDNKRFAEAKRAFWSIITRYEVKNVPLLFIVNKTDLVENERELGKIESFFSLPEIEDRKLAIKFISLVSKEGIKDVINWISEAIDETVLGGLVNK